MVSHARSLKFDHDNQFVVEELDLVALGNSEGLIGWINDIETGKLCDKHENVSYAMITH